jgi:hypothetical protein
MIPLKHKIGEIRELLSFFFREKLLKFEMILFLGNQ